MFNQGPLDFADDFASPALFGRSVFWCPQFVFSHLRVEPLPSNKFHCIDSRCELSNCDGWIRIQGVGALKAINMHQHIRHKFLGFLSIQILKPSNHDLGFIHTFFHRRRGILQLTHTHFQSFTCLLFRNKLGLHLSKLILHVLHHSMFHFLHAGSNFFPHDHSQGCDCSGWHFNLRYGIWSFCWQNTWHKVNRLWFALRLGLLVWCAFWRWAFHCRTWGDHMFNPNKFQKSLLKITGQILPSCFFVLRFRNRGCRFVFLIAIPRLGARCFWILLLVCYHGPWVLQGINLFLWKRHCVAGKLQRNEVKTQKARNTWARYLSKKYLSKKTVATQENWFEAIVVAKHYCFCSTTAMGVKPQCAPFFGSFSALWCPKVHQVWEPNRQYTPGSVVVPHPICAGIFASVAVKPNQTWESGKQLFEISLTEIWETFFVQQYQFVVMEFAPCTLYAIHDFHLSSNSKFAREFAAQKFVCRCAMQNSNHRPTFFNMWCLLYGRRRKTFRFHAIQLQSNEGKFLCQCFKSWRHKSWDDLHEMWQKSWGRQHTASSLT